MIVFGRCPLAFLTDGYCHCIRYWATRHQLDNVREEVD
jgi:hypothetical protein